MVSQLLRIEVTPQNVRSRLETILGTETSGHATTRPSDA